MPRIAFIHTSASMPAVFKPLIEKHLGGSASVQCWHVVDESLLCDLLREGKVPPTTARRVAAQIQIAADAGATHVMVTCSSMGPAVEATRAFTSATVLRVDEAMAQRAASIGKRIGVVATLPSTLAPTVELVRRFAPGATVEAVLVEGAFTAVMSGDGPTHDQLVAGAVRKLMPSCDVVLLAQASMARAVDAMPASERVVPVLASPPLAVEALAKIVHHGGDGGHGGTE
jgi:Asp/Glu/hydantoin racemase